MSTSKAAHVVWKWFGEQGRRSELPPQRWLLTCKGGRVPISNSEGKASTRASEHQGVLTDTFALTIQSEVVRAELATRARGGAAVPGGGTTAAMGAGLLRCYG